MSGSLESTSAAKKMPPRATGRLVADLCSKEAQLSEDQKKKLHAKQVSMFLSNEQYMQAHPELRQLISTFIRRALEDRPENVVVYAAEFFTR
ncbi:conserved hypothetical protein [Perkinsus marinus ATCC 50983]|uniref:RIIa domain-containing protein n=1 Tax=Perkinsus marinus (strain ATCC 50983 / TXsc) TaxID=423536 RepID=C5LYM9_PERM5|nr:conserved hypothetical protein [Perkinsus marinus ATCC 50983]EEQ98267.1 conserved hypothetical protein [Perkinsus marinus ATCC 50983]|eukprot:XP_002765550.1 conserved hypothetical protein [Perkinsus marinus ATCC 50983]